MADEKIVDSVAVPVVGPQSMTTSAAACGVLGPQNPPSTQSVPLKLDAESSAAMAQMLQQMAASQSGEPQYRQINPADVISSVGQRMLDIYARFNVLQELGRHLNGQAVSARLPDSLVVDEVLIKFRSKDAAGKIGQQQTASIKNVACVGDISNLLSTEIGLIILTLQQEISDVQEIVQKSDEHYSKMRKAWEEANPDKIIRPAAEPVAEQPA